MVMNPQINILYVSYKINFSEIYHSRNVEIYEIRQKNNIDLKF